MIKEKIERCLQMTDEIMTTHYYGNHDILEKHIHENCLWIGSVASEYYHGREKILKVLEIENEQLPSVTLTSKEFECVQHDRNSCVIVGCYIGITNTDNKEIYRDMQRVTFVWKEEEKTLYIRHIHVSNPMTVVEKDEIFPHKLGVYTKEYIEMLLRRELRDENVSIKDIGNVHHIIQISDIMYLEAFNHQTIIHTTDGDILTKTLLIDVENKVKEVNSEMMIRVHKSYIVNRYYINSIQRYELSVGGCYRIPISKLRYLEVKEKLHNNKIGVKDNEDIYT